MRQFDHCFLHGIILAHIALVEVQLEFGGEAHGIPRLLHRSNRFRNTIGDTRPFIERPGREYPRRGPPTGIGSLSPLDGMMGVIPGLPHRGDSIFEPYIAKRFALTDRLVRVAFD